MENKYNSIIVRALKHILHDLNHRKKTRHDNNKIFRVDQIISVNTRNCKYVGGKNEKETKTHLNIKFTSPDEKGTICISILLEKCNDLVNI
jgi:hypothetical protein